MNFIRASVPGRHCLIVSCRPQPMLTLSGCPPSLRHRASAQGGRPTDAIDIVPCGCRSYGCSRARLYNTERPHQGHGMKGRTAARPDPRSPAASRRRPGSDELGAVRRSPEASDRPVAPPGRSSPQLLRKSAFLAAHLHSSVRRWNTPYRPVRFSGATSVRCLPKPKTPKEEKMKKAT